MKLVVGLGNPGRKYQGTRHNIGWEVLRQLAERYGASRPKAKFQGEFVEANIDGEPAVLLSPLTYMNRSGNSVQPARDFYKLDNSQLLIICDDFNLPLAKLRIRGKGSAGGQKGLQDVIQRLGEEVPRLRIGIGLPPAGWEVADYVLSKFSKAERSTMDQAVQRAVEATRCWACEGLASCMNQFNADPAEP